MNLIAHLEDRCPRTDANSSRPTTGDATSIHGMYAQKPGSCLTNRIDGGRAPVACSPFEAFEPEPPPGSQIAAEGASRRDEAKTLWVMVSIGSIEGRLKRP